MKKTVSCIIPAYNEGPRIASVLQVASTFPGFDEVIVVDDGSSDDTMKVARRFPVTVIRHVENQGKAAAVFTGLKKSTGEVIVLIDGDLAGVEHRSIEALIQPVRTENCMTLSLRGNTWPVFHWEGADPWSGERAMPREILELVFQDITIVQKRYAIESYINEQVLKKGWPIYSVDWPNARNVPKSDKGNGQLTGLLSDLKMFSSIFGTFGVAKTIAQQIKVPQVVRKHKSNG